MAHPQRFEDLIAWQKARNLTKLIYRMCRTSGLAKDRMLSTQIQRAAVSIMSNIAEGCERPSDKEFVHFLAIAKASCAEVRSQLFVALDAEYIDQATFDELYTLATEVGRLSTGLRNSIVRRLKNSSSP